jgi:hypothetical protein
MLETTFLSYNVKSTYFRSNEPKKLLYINTSPQKEKFQNSHFLVFWHLESDFRKIIIKKEREKLKEDIRDRIRKANWRNSKR